MTIVRISAVKCRKGQLDDTARNKGLLLASAEDLGLWPRLIMLFLPVLGHFWCPVVTLVNNFEKNPKTTKKIKIK